MQQFFRFGVVGTLGFITDASFLVIFVHWWHIHPLAARPFSFLIANFVTWWCNRHFTFTPVSHRKKLHEWSRYVTVNGLGAVVNLGVYSVLVAAGKGIFALPLVALAIACLVAMFFNFFSSKHFAFS